MSYTAIIKNGTVIDGTGNKPVVADIGIQNKKIAKIGNLQKEAAELTIDATGLYVAPGFVDLTTHSDTHWTLFSQPGQESFIKQGITTILGGHGGVCGGANLLPGLYVELYNATCSRDLPRVEKLHAKVMELSTSIYHVGRYQSSFLKGLKCALSCVGICSDFLAEPFHRFRQPEHEVIERYVKELGITCER